MSNSDFFHGGGGGGRKDQNTTKILNGVSLAGR